MSHYNEQFLKQSPLAVLGVLRDLHKQQVPVRLEWSNGQFISKILEVSADRLVLDFGSQSQENLSVQKATHIEFIAETQGAKVEFSLPGLKATEYQNLPAFTTPLPPSLWFVQRREYFRITAPCSRSITVAPNWPMALSLPSGSATWSLGGMGALVDGTLPPGLAPGLRFGRVEMDLVEWGKFYFDMQLVMVSERKVVDSKNETISTPRLSFRFLNVNPAVERELQKIIFSLERSAREKANRVK
ncbi:Cyclic di-GMP binding protein YcgR [Cedecea neteri]|uniref:Flagellar brake protein YcgR n=1 Tax=Cedecea neteri TaxID=158822 RepID=A0A2X3IKB2_9ENTR|nr:Cyclic di-GMP binding protein YcgR [Cedecea neteri]